ncbi:hypothetical protein VFPFJ_10010 [Purpureocillium lilacinum]|uniref:Uncharacterized protein n=1 Tax=Purpureocillium lilacinum TaxID=33203 RepID=A0A179GNQ6_PURLI|nr:hypothetical protein VFPFJ_10010 [Purpureocillium lilacinum]OAQ79524.1 hypothetical protein VFPFJ_10010 [Purpureocillium lilacinum]
MATRAQQAENVQFNLGAFREATSRWDRALRPRHSFRFVRPSLPRLEFVLCYVPRRTNSNCALSLVFVALDIRTPYVQHDLRCACTEYACVRSSPPNITQHPSSALQSPASSRKYRTKKKNIRPSIRSVPRTTLPRATWFWSRRPPITLFLSAVHYSHRNHAWSSLSTPVPGRRRRRAKNKRHHIGEIL